MISASPPATGRVFRRGLRIRTQVRMEPRFFAAAIVARRTTATYVRCGVEARLRRRILEHFQRLPMAWHRRHPTELLAHAESDVVNAVEVLNPVPLASGVGLLLVLTAGWLLATDPVLRLVAMVLFPTVILLSQRLNPGSNTTSRRLSAAPARVSDGGRELRRGRSP